MRDAPNLALLAAGILSAVAALMHLGCIVIGASCYRILGAGEHMAMLAENGHWYPTAITGFIASVLIVWAFYAFSAAGVFMRLPFRRFVLILITSLYLLRGFAFQPLMAYFPDNSREFWFWTSAITLAVGLVHLVGLTQVWRRI